MNGKLCVSRADYTDIDNRKDSNSSCLKVDDDDGGGGGGESGGGGSGSGNVDGCSAGLVGFQVRFNSKYNKNTRILFCTTGLLLRRLQNPDFIQTITHIVVDEVHERQIETDLLLSLLKDQYKSIPRLKIIIMSATIQERLISRYVPNLEDLHAC